MVEIIGSGKDESCSTTRKLVENSYGFNTLSDAAKIFSVLGPFGKFLIVSFSNVMIV